MKQRQKTEIKSLTLDDLRAYLKEFEAQYGVSSEEFYRKFEAGETPDDGSEEFMDSIEWAGIYEILTLGDKPTE